MQTSVKQVLCESLAGMLHAAMQIVWAQAGKVKQALTGASCILLSLKQAQVDVLGAWNADPGLPAPCDAHGDESFV